MFSISSTLLKLSIQIIVLVHSSDVKSVFDLSEVIEEIANEHGIDPEIAGIMSIGEHSTLRNGSDESRRQMIEQATQRYNEENPVQAQALTEDGIAHGRHFYPFKANGRSNSNIEDHCSICLENIDPLLGNHVKAPCGHRFHVHCLNEWAQREFLANRIVRCPICRSTDVEKLTRIPEVVVRRP